MPSKVIKPTAAKIPSQKQKKNKKKQNFFPTIMPHQTN